jgi:hypothetical protein
VEDEIDNCDVVVTSKHDMEPSDNGKYGDQGDALCDAAIDDDEAGDRDKRDGQTRDASRGVTQCDVADETTHAVADDNERRSYKCDVKDSDADDAVLLKSDATVDDALKSAGSRGDPEMVKNDENPSNDSTNPDEDKKLEKGRENISAVTMMNNGCDAAATRDNVTSSDARVTVSNHDAGNLEKDIKVCDAENCVNCDHAEARSNIQKPTKAAENNLNGHVTNVNASDAETRTTDSLAETGSKTCDAKRGAHNNHFGTGIKACDAETSKKDVVPGINACDAETRHAGARTNGSDARVTQHRCAHCDFETQFRGKLSTHLLSRHSELRKEKRKF